MINYKCIKAWPGLLHVGPCEGGLRQYSDSCEEKSIGMSKITHSWNTKEARKTAEQDDCTSFFLLLHVVSGEFGGWEVSRVERGGIGQQGSLDKDLQHRCSSCGPEYCTHSL